MSRRWPLHPIPIRGEALTSWLIRVADCYEMELKDLLLYEWGQANLTDLDIRPPDGFLEMIAKRSGFDLGEFRGMTMAGWVPWLFDSFDSEEDAFNCYTHQFSVLLPPRPDSKKTVQGWRAWLPKQNLNRACPTCINLDSAENSLKLAWQFPLMSSCPKHSCRLETYYYYPSLLFPWEKTEISPLPASGAIVEMDRLTEQAFATGQVNLPRRNVHAGVWFRLLRTIIEELNTPISRCGRQAKSIRQIWEKAGFSCRAGLKVWRSYEALDLSIQLQFLEATATAINMVQNEEINALGENAELFLSEPKTWRNANQPLKPRKSDVKVTDHWKIVKDSLNQAIEEAKQDPQSAQSFFRLMLFGQTDEKRIEALRQDFNALGIPAEWCQI